MASSFLRNKNNTRPKKKASLRARRVSQHRARAVELGLDAEVVRKMNAQDLRAALRHPSKVCVEKA